MGETWFPSRDRAGGEGAVSVTEREALLHVVRGAVAALERSRTRIDDLNVYPVPDGDTGTNLALTSRALLEVTWGQAASGLLRPETKFRAEELRRRVSPSSSGELPGNDPGNPPQLARHSHGTLEFRRATGRGPRRSSTTRSALSSDALVRDRRAVCQRTQA